MSVNIISDFFIKVCKVQEYNGELGRIYADFLEVRQIINTVGINYL